MDFLKYLDILIALAVVMVLLSPIVTAITHFIMMIGNLRSSFLQHGLTILITQLNAGLHAVLEVQDPQGVAVTGVTIEPVGAMSANSGRLVPEDGLVKAVSHGVLRLTVTKGQPLAGHKVTATLFPQATDQSTKFESLPSDAVGKTTFTYSSTEAEPFRSRAANVIVKDAAGNPVPANIVCALLNKQLTVSIGAQQPAFSCPAELRLPASGPIECTITDAQNNPLAAHVVHFEFLRNPEFDAVITLPPTDAEGKAAYTIQSSIAEAVLLHPMIARARSDSKLSSLLAVLQNRKGEVIVREELVRVLLELAANEGAGANLLDKNTRDVLRHVLLTNGISSPSEALSKIRDAAQMLEKDSPHLAEHIRQANAIITAARSDFVGKINNWFDQTMDRVTQRFASRARLITVAGAFAVALLTQINSWDLLRRLSSDDNLRNALVGEAKDQATHIENMTAQAKETPQNSLTQDQIQNEIKNAQAKREEIEQNIAKLRRPGISILPDHFAWEKVPQARLMENPTWKPPYPPRFEFVAGGASYVLSPRWSKGPIQDLKAAIDAAGAPLETDIESGPPGILLTARTGDTVQIVAAGIPENDLLMPLAGTAQARLKTESISKIEFKYDMPNSMELVLEASPAPKAPLPPVPLSLTVTKQDVDTRTGLLGKIAQSLNAPKTGVKAVCDDPNACKELTVIAADPEVHNITLRGREGDPFSNILGDTHRVSNVGWLDSNRLREATNQGLELVTASRRVPLKEPDIEKLLAAINKANVVDAKGFTPQQLVITSERLGPIQLRYDAGHPETNILNGMIENVRRIDFSFGILLSWALLSLGAPFWYDALKELMRLRPSLAAKEEAQRNERQAEQQPKPPPKP